MTRSLRATLRVFAPIHYMRWFTVWFSFSVPCAKGGRREGREGEGKEGREKGRKGEREKGRKGGREREKSKMKKRKREREREGGEVGGRKAG
jgi:hypothetical protein